MKTKKKILFIINPISGIGKKNKLPGIIENSLKPSYITEIIYTEYAGHGHEIALAKKNEFDLIVAVGGDGSINEIGSALIDSECALGIIPCGSGNGFARHHKIPLRPKQAVQIIKHWNITCVDTGVLNEKPFLGNCGAGFDAHVAKKFNFKGKRGFANYIRLVLQEFKKFEEFRVDATVDGTKMQKQVLLVNVSNGSQFGNNFYISPNSKTDDGIMELIFLRKFTRLKSIRVGLKFFSKSIANSKYYESVSFKKEVHLTISENIPVQIDGDPVPLSHELKISFKPKSLNLLIP